MRLPEVNGSSVWIRLAAILVIGGAVAAVWTWTPRPMLAPDEFAAWLMPHRHAWYALPFVILAFVALGLVMVPVALLILITGLAFGPMLGPAYAMAGSLASASTGFAIGRWLGLRRVERLGDERILRLTQQLKRHGTLAVFLVRKVPAPFTLLNVIVGASTVRFQDFFVGTLLGMIAFVVGLAGFGSQSTKVFSDPTPGRLLAAALFVLVPLAAAIVINRRIRSARAAE